MARLARVVLPGVVHHVTQRGVRSMDIFYHDKDRKEYLFLLNQQTQKVGLRFVAYCLMTNHVHLLVIPSKENSLKLGIGEAHRLYTRYINFRESARGHLFQERFFSCPLDDPHFISAARYVERNPVRAKICKKAEEYQWSSAKYHLSIRKRDPLIKSRYEGIPSLKDWHQFLKKEPYGVKTMKIHFRTGRPFGSELFMDQAESITGRKLRPKKSGPK
jgi:putative transposase